MSELLAELFSSRVRAAVLTLMLPRPHLSFSLTDLSRRLELPVSSVQHECNKLTRIGLLSDHRIANVRRYRPDVDFSLLKPLTALTLRSLPLADALRGGAEEVPGIERAWVSGKVDAGATPVYLVVVGWLDLEVVDGLFDRSRKALSSVSQYGNVELAFFPPAEWAERMTIADPFTAALLAEPRIDIVPLRSKADVQKPDMA